MTDTAIVTEGLTKQYAEVRALTDLNLEVRQGEIFGFLGPNGAGKTTTIRLLLDLIRPTSGRAEILGYDCCRQSQDVRARVGYLPGDLRLYHRLRGQQVVDFISGLRTRTVDSGYVAQLAERLNLDLHGHVGAYSKGTRQKLGALLALIDHPSVLLLDEPTSGLDPPTQHTLWEILQEEADNGSTIFFSSHVLHEVEHLCSRVGLLRAGRLIAVEPVAKLLGRSVRRLEVTFDDEIPAGTFRLSGVEELEREDHTVRLNVTGDPDILIKALAHYHVSDIRSEQLDLEDVLLPYFHEDVPV